MNKFTDIINNDEQINEAALNANKLTYIPVDLGKDSKVGQYGVAVGNKFNIKQGAKYCQQLEQMFQEMGIAVTVGLDKAKEVISKGSTKLMYVIYTQGENSMAMIVSANNIKPLDKALKLI